MTKLISMERHFTFAQAVAASSRQEAFMATVYAMNTLLLDKGIYTREEFEALFIEWVERELEREAEQRAGDFHSGKVDNSEIKG